jgi:hypothetical protein
VVQPEAVVADITEVVAPQEIIVAQVVAAEVHHGPVLVHRLLLPQEHKWVMDKLY